MTKNHFGNPYIMLGMLFDVNTVAVVCQSDDTIIANTDINVGDRKSIIIFCSNSLRHANTIPRVATEGDGKDWLFLPVLLLHLGVEAEAEEDRTGTCGCRPARGCEGVRSGASGW